MNNTELPEPMYFPKMPGPVIHWCGTCGAKLDNTSFDCPRCEEYWEIELEGLAHIREKTK